MSVYHNISKVPFSSTRAIIINVSTRLCTTLAILSVKKRTNLPLLVVDCPYNGKSDFEALKQLSIEYDFDLIQLPLQKHGCILDYIFREIHAENILLVDSDLEILDGSIVDEMIRISNYDNFFGCGVSHGPCMIDVGAFFCKDIHEDGMYAERMWIPFTLLNVKKIREALFSGKSFVDRIQYNIIPWNQKISKFLFWHFHKLCSNNFFRKYKVAFGGNVSNVIYYDTGSDVYNFLKDVKYYSFSCIRYEQFIHGRFVRHYEGITRKILSGDKDMSAANIDNEKEFIIEKLKKEYMYTYK